MRNKSRKMLTTPITITNFYGKFTIQRIIRKNKIKRKSIILNQKLKRNTTVIPIFIQRRFNRK